MPADTHTAASRRKLIEVALPLERINMALKAEKDRKVGKPQNNHHWWSRKPITAARVVLFAQLVDDPSSHPDRFPTAESVSAERRRLHALIEELSEWEAYRDDDLLRRARKEIIRSTNGNPPDVIDPFCGGGSIPLEAQRFGLASHGSDLNPVAVLITKALTEIPPIFRGMPPAFPDSSATQMTPWSGMTGLADDVRRYGEWMRLEAEKKIGHLYPPAELPDGSLRRPIAWIWARTVKCANPACGIDMPLVSKWWLSKKKGKEFYLAPRVENGVVCFDIKSDTSETSFKVPTGTVSRSGAVCVGCGTPAKFEYIRSEGRSGRIGSVLTAMVCDGGRARVFLEPTEDQDAFSGMERPTNAPDGSMFNNPRNFNTLIYGMTEFSDLFTSRQLTAMIVFCDLVAEVREKVLQDCLKAGMAHGEPLSAGGTGAKAYADAVAVFLGIAVSRLSDWNSNVCAWEPNGQVSQHVFVQQSIGMTWDFSEANPLGIKTSGSFDACIRSVTSSLEKMTSSIPGFVNQTDAKRQSYEGKLVSTDPPYFMQIGYSDLSDFFYVWLRRALGDVYPDLFSTVLVPKSDELVANEYRHGGKNLASDFFQQGFREVFKKIRLEANPDFPLTVYYASKEAGARSGWESILGALLESGWSIVATWPVHEGMASRPVGQGTNALGSSVVMVLRPRDANAPVIDRRSFTRELKDELPEMLRELQEGKIAPVDFQQAAIGPGMSIFSKYSSILEDDGSSMTVRSALDRINLVLDEINYEQEDEFDYDTRFAITWFRQFGFDSGPYVEADKYARVRNASLDHLERSGILTKPAGKVTLLSPDSLDKRYSGSDYNPGSDAVISTWEVVMHLSRVLNSKGVPAAANLLSRVPDTIDRDLCKELAFLLYSIAEGSKRMKIAVDFNSLGTAWNDIVSESRTASTQLTLDT